MGEKLELNQFDILGVINLKEVQGIEKYVTPVIEDGKIADYLSRSEEYYNVKSMSELAVEREQLAQMLTCELSKRNFVIIENMLNCSGKVYFKKFEQYIASGKNEHAELQLSQAEECLMEDVRNMLAIFQNEGAIQIDSQKRLPGGFENAEKRAIEMDNKAILYLFTKSLKLQKASEVEVVTPGYGSLYIGPFLKAMYGCEFTNILKSKYIEESNNLQQNSIMDLMSSSRPFESNKTILLLDDNIGTGKTISELQKSLKEEGIKSTISGAVQYNWRNYYRVSVGEKTGIEKPNIGAFDILTPFNFAGHKLYKHSIDILHSSGSEYIEYLHSKSYRSQECTDIEGTLRRTATSLNKMGIQLPENLEKYVIYKAGEQNKEILPQFEENPTCIVSNPVGKKIMNRIVQEAEETLDVRKKAKADITNNDNDER